MLKLPQAAPNKKRWCLSMEKKKGGCLAMVGTTTFKPNRQDEDNEIYIVARWFVYFVGWWLPMATGARWAL